MYFLQRHTGRGRLHLVRMPGVCARDQPVLPVQGAEYRIYVPEVRVPGAIIMGNVALIVKIMPESPDVDREALKAAVRAAVPVDDIQEEPIGFGLVALKAAVVVPDSAGAPDKVEAALQKIEGVASAEIVESTLV
jgi:elongation factor 1-beta